MFALLLLLVFSSTTPVGASVSWHEDLPPALAAAKAKHGLVLLDFSAPWCYSCYYMDQHVLGEPEMDSVASKLELVRLDVDSVEGAKLRREYMALGLPNYVVLDDAGAEVGRIVGEQTKESFFRQLREILERNSPLARLEAQAKGGKGAQAVSAAAQVMKAYSQRNTPKEGLDFYGRLPQEVKQGVESDSRGRIELLRLKLLAAYGAKDTDTCERIGRVLLEGRNDCELMYDALYLQHCFDSATSAQRKKSFAYQRRPLESLLSKGVFGKPAERCPDLLTPAEVGVKFYQTVGEKKQASKLLSRLIKQTQDELGGDVSRDRNKADNLKSFLELAEKKSELAALYPRLIAAYPKDYVYPYLYGRFLLESGDAGKALEILDGAKKMAYGAGVLRVANARAKAMAKLGRKGDAIVELDAALKDNPATFPKEIASLQKTRDQLKN